MKPLRALILAVALTAIPTTAALAQMDGTNEKYAEERRQDRASNRKFKMIAGGIAVVVVGGMWVVKKIKGDGPTTPGGPQA